MRGLDVLLLAEIRAPHPTRFINDSSVTSRVEIGSQRRDQQDGRCSVPALGLGSA